MKKEQIGNVILRCPEHSYEGGQQEKDEDKKQLWEMIQLYDERQYHEQITVRKNWTVMYQLAESRANCIEWLKFPRKAKVLELGAGCGTVTSVLLKKGACVTCQDEHADYCRMNAVRHKDAAPGMLTVYVATFAQCEPLLADDYDIAVLAEMPPAIQQTAQQLHLLRRHVKPDGVLVLAVPNKFGLKYWAGNKEPQTHRYFAGLENAGIQLFSKNSLSNLLEQSGFGRQRFYYPYPDHRFARDIYSDRYLPKKGELSYNIANYEDDRILLFDEQKVFDSIIEEEQFPFFANSFLCLAGQRDNPFLEQEVYYTRYASDRSREYAVRTDITKEAVCKHPVYREGAAHIKHIAKAYEQLSLQYKDTDLKFNRCRLLTDEDGFYAQFEFIHAQALQTHIEQAIAADNIKAVFSMLHKLARYIRNDKNSVPFTVTEAFMRVFGNVGDEAVLRGTTCSKSADIDLILPNILVGEDGTWHVIDYEWTFFFPVPHNFIIYRTLFFLNRQNPDHPKLSMDILLKKAGIPPEEAMVYEKMEEGFQRYVTGGLIPYREMVNLLGRGYLNVTQLKAEYDLVKAHNELLKGRGVWKIARKIKKKLTGN